MLDELRLARRAGGEVVEQRVVRHGSRMRTGRRGVHEGLGVVPPSVGSTSPDTHARIPARHVIELGCVLASHNHVAHPTALDSVRQVVGSEGSRCRHDNRAELENAQHRLPQLDLVAEHHHDRVAAPDAERAQPRSDLIGSCRHLIEGSLHARSVRRQHDQCRTLVATGNGVEPVDCPVERTDDIRPAEFFGRGSQILAECDQLVTRRAVLLEGAAR